MIESVEWHPTNSMQRNTLKGARKRRQRHELGYIGCNRDDFDIISKKAERNGGLTGSNSTHSLLEFTYRANPMTGTSTRAKIEAEELGSSVDFESTPSVQMFLEPTDYSFPDFRGKVDQWHYDTFGGFQGEPSN